MEVYSTTRTSPRWTMGAPHTFLQSALYSVIGSQTLTDVTFATALNEIEAFLSNRPITDVPTDINDTDALTPNHFLLGRAHMAYLSTETTTRHNSYDSMKSRQEQEFSKFQLFALHQ